MLIGGDTAPQEALRDIAGPSKAIRDLNDAFRRGLPYTTEGQRLVLTSGVAELDNHALVALLGEVRSFSEFEPGNDPHEEHDFGAVEILGDRFFWKIDYYDRSFDYGSPNPADPAVTVRVMTIMLADEY